MENIPPVFVGPIRFCKIANSRRSKSVKYEAIKTSMSVITKKYKLIFIRFNKLIITNGIRMEIIIKYKFMEYLFN
jgi:hypothetical protein